MRHCCIKVNGKLAYHYIECKPIAANYVAEDNDYLVPVYVVTCNLVAQLIFIFLYKDVINEKAN